MVKLEHYEIIIKRVKSSQKYGCLRSQFVLWLRYRAKFEKLLSEALEWQSFLIYILYGMKFPSKNEQTNRKIWHEPKNV